MAESVNSVQLTFKMGSEYPTLYVANFRCIEQISRLYHLELDLYADRGGTDLGEVDADKLDLEAAIGKPAELLITSPWLGTEIRRFCGVVNQIEQLGRGHGYQHYRVSVVPRVWRLTQHVNCRIFQETDVKTIIETLLDEHSLKLDTDFKISLNQTPVERLYCVQYRESDWDFISRLLEEEGIYYFFKHDESDKDVVVFGQDPSLHPAIQGADATVPYFAREDALPDRESVQDFSMGEHFQTGNVRLRDWNFEQPDLKNKGMMEALAPESSPHNALELYDYPGGYAVPDTVGKSYAKVRLEEMTTRRKIAVGSSTCTRFMSGHTFTLARCFRRDFDQEYNLIEVQHMGSAKAGADEALDGRCDYQNSFRCILKNAPFRPSRLTPKPAIHGVQTALVVGPEGEEIHTDDRGRVKIKFHWDRSEDMEAPTCWIRVAQVWASPSFGAYFLPRIGQEVVVSFEEGDPDRPLVTGCVYYGATPHLLPEEKTKSIIKTNSSPGGEGANVLYFEDKKDSEEIYIHGQKDWTIQIENDKTEAIGHDQTLTVENNRTKTVKVDQTETIEGNKSITVKKNHNEEIEGRMTLSVAKDSSEDVTGAKDLTVEKDYSVSINGAVSETIKKDRTIGIDGGRTESIKKDSTSSAKNITFEAKDQITLKVGKAEITMKKDGEITISGGKITIKSTKDTLIKSSAKATVQASKDITVKSSAKVVLKGSQVTGN